MSRAREITLALGGDWSGSYGLAPTPGHSPKDRGLKIWDAPDLPGGVGVHSFNGADWTDVRDELRAAGLLDDARDETRPDPVALEARRQALREQKQREDARRTTRARAIWSASTLVTGTLAETYLREARGIRRATLPATLRYNPAVPVYPLSDRRCDRLPAMVAAVAFAGERSLTGVHITYLRSDGGGKADISPPRKMVGPCKGAAVRLDPSNDRLALAEGIETALSYSDRFSAPVWACLTAGGMEAVKLPDDLRRLEIAHDVDLNGRGQRAAEIVAKRAYAAGVKVFLAPPPDGFNDWNAAPAQEAA